MLRVLLTNPCASAVQSLATARYLLAPLTANCIPDPAIKLMASSLVLVISLSHCVSTQVTAHLNTFITFIKLLTLIIITFAGLAVLGSVQSQKIKDTDSLAQNFSSDVSSFFGREFSLLW